MVEASFKLQKSGNPKSNAKSPSDVDMQLQGVRHPISRQEPISWESPNPIISGKKKHICIPIKRVLCRKQCILSFAMAHSGQMRCSSYGTPAGRRGCGVSLNSPPFWSRSSPTVAGGKNNVSNVCSFSVEKGDYMPKKWWKKRHEIISGVFGFVVTVIHGMTIWTCWMGGVVTTHVVYNVYEVNDDQLFDVDNPATFAKQRKSTK